MHAQHAEHDSLFLDSFQYILMAIAVAAAIVLVIVIILVVVIVSS